MEKTSEPFDEAAFRNFFEGATLKITPRDHNGPFRYVGVVTKIIQLIDVVKLTVHVIRTIDVKWQCNREGEVVYFFPKTGIWSFSSDVNELTKLMVEKTSLSYLQNTDMFKRYGLFASGDDIRRFLKDRFEIALRLEDKTSGEEFDFEFDMPNRKGTDFVIGSELRVNLVRMLENWPAHFSSEEREMLEIYLSYYKEF